MIKRILMGFRDDRKHWIVLVGATVIITIVCLVAVLLTINDSFLVYFIPDR